MIPKSGWGQEVKYETLGECFTLHRICEDQRTPKASPGLKRGFLAGWLLLVPQILRVTWVCLSRELVGVKCQWRCGGRAGPRENSPVLTPARAGVRACVHVCWGWGGGGSCSAPRTAPHMLVRKTVMDLHYFNSSWVALW